MARFGRKRGAADQQADAVVEETVGEEITEAADAVDQSEGDLELAEQWQAWDASFDRDEGPFDIEEVDLDADDVTRVDLGAVVVTPFPNMKLQLQVDKASQRVQSIVVTDGASALEVAAFAGPTRSSMLSEIRGDAIAAAERENGKVEVVEGPFGAELRRRVPVKDPEGRAATHVSRTWLVDGPGWVLRGVLMGKAALDPADEAASVTLFEFFSNLVVRRGTKPVAPGNLLYMSVPEGKQS